MENATPQNINNLPSVDNGAAAAADFGVRLFQTALEDDKNTLISPLSVLYALSMTANGADGETRKQMEEVLGMDIQSLNSFMAAYMKNLPTSEAYKLHLANGIWFREDLSFEVNRDFLQTNANDYNAEIRKAAFDEATRKEINAWVKTNTDGMTPYISIFTDSASACSLQYEDGQYDGLCYHVPFDGNKVFNS
jgi:serpin B